VSGTDILSVLLIALGLSADCFAVALGGGVNAGSGVRWRMLRLALSFGFFQAVMPVIGWLAGSTVVKLIADYDHWVAFGLLAIVSGRMLWEAFGPGEHQEEKELDISRGLLLLSLSVATSIDALAVGLSFAFIDINIAIASPVIGVVAFAVTAIGFYLGRKVGKLAVGGIILLAIAVRILLSHLMG
jgi:putative Mn2+ efflux pump MntP